MTYSSTTNFHSKSNDSTMHNVIVSSCEMASDTHVFAVPYSVSVLTQPSRSSTVKQTKGKSNDNRSESEVKLERQGLAEKLSLRKEKRKLVERSVSDMIEGLESGLESRLGSYKEDNEPKGMNESHITVASLCNTPSSPTFMFDVEEPHSVLIDEAYADSGIVNETVGRKRQHISALQLEHRIRIQNKNKRIESLETSFHNLRCEVGRKDAIIKKLEGVNSIQRTLLTDMAQNSQHAEVSMYRTSEDLAMTKSTNKRLQDEMKNASVQITGLLHTRTRLLKTIRKFEALGKDDTLRERMQIATLRNVLTNHSDAIASRATSLPVASMVLSGTLLTLAQVIKETRAVIMDGMTAAVIGCGDINGNAPTASAAANTL